MTGALAALSGAGAGLLALLALREAHSSLPALIAWVRRTAQPLVEAGRTGYRPSRGEGRRLSVATGVAGALSGWIMFGAAAGVALAAAGPFAVRALLRRRRSRYRRRVEASLPAIATAMADSLSAGRSLRSALTDCAGMLDGAAATELSLLAAELDLGTATVPAVRGMVDRVGSTRIEAFGTAITAGRDSGADLAALLRRLADSAEQHERSLRDARAATSQARFTGLLVAAMPLGAGLMAELLNPGFFAGIVGSPITLMMAAVALGLQVAGYFAIRRLARARV